jgi:dTDP-4-amino-4,6-dideoxygalactose transaminase
MIPYGRQDISQADIDAVVEVLRSDSLTQGLMVPRFEQAVAEYCRVQYGVAVGSATSNLYPFINAQIDFLVFISDAGWPSDC